MFIQILTVVLLVALDQFSKYLAVLYLQPVSTAPLLPGVLQLFYVENDGAAFSILAGNQIFLIIITTVALLALCFWLFFKKPEKRLERICLVLILAGGIGNLIDRVLHRYVVDFFEVQFMQFAVFNVADIFVTVGVALLLISVISDEIKAYKAKGKTNDNA